MKGRKAIVSIDLFTKTGKRKKLNMSEVVTITSSEPDEKNMVSVTSTFRNNPIHNVPLEILIIQ